MSYNPFRHIDSILWKRNPIQLTFFVTRRCNARCSFCFYLSDNESADSSELELSFDEIKKISSSVGQLLWLAFSGGEIFLRNDIVEITKLFYEKNRPAIILFPTNGLLTDVIKDRIESVLNHCDKSIIVVKLSLEGTERLHDSIRGDGSFRKTIETYNILKPLLYRYQNFELGINTVFCAANQDGMDELIEFVNGLEKIRTHTVSLIRGTVSENSLKNIDIDKYNQTINKIALNLRKNISDTYHFKGARIKAAQDIVQRNLIYDTMTQKKQLTPCYAGKLNLVITETGDIYPCESFDMKMGNVRDNGYSIKNILKTDKAQKIIRSIKDNGCYCTHECYLMTNILFNPKLYPRIAKEYLQIKNIS